MRRCCDEIKLTRDTIRESGGICCCCTGILTCIPRMVLRIMAFFFSVSLLFTSVIGVIFVLTGPGLFSLDIFYDKAASNSSFLGIYTLLLLILCIAVYINMVKNTSRKARARQEYEEIDRRMATGNK